jgi:hypothetical protein
MANAKRFARKIKSSRVASVSRETHASQKRNLRIFNARNSARLMKSLSTVHVSRRILARRMKS